MALIERALQRRPNKSFKPNSNRYAITVGLSLVLGVLVSNSLLTKLQAALSDTSGVYINVGVDAQNYLASLASDVLANCCTPFSLSATVMAPGFPDAALGSTITGQCLAHRAGYWLVYQPEQDRFYCFWGRDPANLGAHGVFGSPLYCWSA